jgi:uncharacterized damage-inducible protein DinB
MCFRKDAWEHIIRSKEHTNMTEQASALITFYKGWENYQQGLVETIASLSSEQLAFPIASHHWSIGMLLTHMIDARVLWFQLWMGEGNPDLAHWNDDEQPVREAAELVAMFEKTWHTIADALARWTSADLEHLFPTPAFVSEEEREDFPPCTRQWIVWHVLEHEIHHGGELSLALGGYGLESFYTW